MTDLIKIYPNDNMSFNIENFTEENAKDNVKFEIILEKEGKRLSEDSFELDIEPGKNYWYFLEPEEDLADGEYVYTLTAKAKKGVGDSKRGTILANNQKIFHVQNNTEKETEKEYEPIAVEDTGADITLKGENFEAKFSKSLGGLVKLDYDGVEYLSSKPLITFWRPLTDTDIHLGLQFDYAQFFGATIGQQLLPEKYYFEDLGGSYRLTFVYRYPLPGGQESAVIYTVHPSGKLDIESTYSGLATIDTMPTFAINFKLDKSFDAIRYYGYGPEENYVDTTEGLNLSVYETTVRKNFKKHERPQETGNRTGVRWADVYNPKTGKGLRFSSNHEAFQFTALPYNDLEIEAAQTKAELPKHVFTNVRIAEKIAGVGDGEVLEDWAKVDAGEMIELNFSIAPITIKVEKPKKPEKPEARLEKEPKKVEEKKEKPVAKADAKAKGVVKKEPEKADKPKVADKTAKPKEAEKVSKVKVADKPAEKEPAKKPAVKAGASKPTPKDKVTKQAVKSESKKPEVKEKSSKIKDAKKKK